MKIFTKMYEVCLVWAKHKYAVYYLGIMSFFESVIFPIPVDVMLAPMCLARLDKAWHYAMVATVTSVAGGVFGYYLGVFLFDSMIQPLFVEMGHMETFNQVAGKVREQGAWIVFISAFAPIPYKLVTISAGITEISIFEFLVASVTGRAGRFYLVAFLLRLGGEKMEQKLHQIIDYIGWGIVIVAFLGYLMYKYI